MPCGLKIALNSPLHNLSFSRLSPNRLSLVLGTSLRISVREEIPSESPERLGGKGALSSAACTAAVFTDGEWLCPSARAAGGASAPGCTWGRAGEGNRVWSKSPVISLPSFLLLPRGGISWHGGTTCSPRFAAPSSPGALLPPPPARRAGAWALPGSLWGSGSLLFPRAGGSKPQPGGAAFVCGGPGRPGPASAGAAGGGGCGSRWSLPGGSPFTARLGEGWLASHMVSSQLSSSMGL